LRDTHQILNPNQKINSRCAGCTPGHHRCPQIPEM
jgi:hypothetical protein